MKKKKGRVDRGETFDEFLAKDGLLAEIEDAALKEIVTDQIKVAITAEDPWAATVHSISSIRVGGEQISAPSP